MSKQTESRGRRTGQIVQRGDKWVVRIFLGRGANGKRRYLNQTIHGTKKDAQKFLTATLREIDLGSFVEPASDSLNDYLDKWLESAARPRLRERSYVDYVALLRRYVRPALGAHKLANIRPLDIQKVYAGMQENGLSARVVRYTHAVLRSSLKQAVQWGMISRNPADSVQLPKQVRKEMKAMTVDEVGKFLKAMNGQRLASLFALAITTGMRPGEYLGLQWKDIDLKKGMVIVQRGLVWRTGGGWYFSEPKTAKSRRSMPIPPTMVRTLKAHRLRQAEERLKAGPLWQNHDLVFTTETGSPLSIENLHHYHFKPALKRAKLPMTFRLYDLRHTCATLLLLAGEHAKVVSERLGHSTITLTLDVYSHVLPDMQQSASDKLEKLLFRKKR